jgi:hypothetical protein
LPGDLDRGVGRRRNGDPDTLDTDVRRAGIIPACRRFAQAVRFSDTMIWRY